MCYRRFTSLLVCLVAAAILGTVPGPSRAQDDLVLEAGGTVVAIVDGDTLLLDDGREIRLVGIQAPKLPLGRPDFAPWPLADAAKAALERLAMGRGVRLGYGGRRMDRHGRVLAHLFRDDEAWIQGALLSLGMARVYSFADNRARVADMLALERRARAAGLGIWSDPFYAVRAAAAVAADIGSFQVVEGRVTRAENVRGRVYLNFGADWRDDFTVTLAPAVRRRFESEAVDPLGYQGRRVRVRGWIKSFNGPMIEATHPEQIEVLTE